eukprot:12610102-Alexandrium_andersonii.AAC.1
MISGRSHVREWQRVDTTRGVYKTLAAVAVEFGVAADRDRSLRAAAVYCKKCAMLQGKWCYYDEMSEQLMFLLLTVPLQNQKD